MKKSEFLAQLADELISERERLFPVATRFAEILGVTKQALSYREANRYKGIGPDDLALVMRVLEKQAEANSQQKTAPEERS